MSRRSLVVALALALVGCGGDPPPDEPEVIIKEPTRPRKPTRRDPADEKRIRELEARARRDRREHREELAAEAGSEEPGDEEGAADDDGPPPAGKRRVPANVKLGELRGFRLQRVQVHEEDGEWTVGGRVSNRTSRAWNEAVFLVRFLDRGGSTLGQVRLRAEAPPTSGAWRDLRSAGVGAQQGLSLVHVSFEGGSEVEASEEEVAVPIQTEGVGGFRFRDRKVTRKDREYWRFRSRLVTKRHEWRQVRFRVEWFNRKWELVHTGRIVVDDLRKRAERSVEVQGPDYRHRVGKIRIVFDGGE